MANSIDKKERKTLEEVFEAITQERKYQLLRWGYPTSTGDDLIEVSHSVSDFLVYMDSYLREAMDVATRTPGNEAALESVKKVVTLGIACLEQNGVKTRNTAAVENARDGLVRKL